MNQQKSISSGLNDKILGLPKNLFYGLLISILIIIFGSIIYAIYQKFFNKSPSPTTLAPTTLAPTTLAPTTLAPTTLAPITLAPTISPGIGRYIKVYNTVVGCMDFTEIKVYSTDPNKNIANTATITASSDWQNRDFKRNWVDGNITAGGHTSCYDIPWMQLDFSTDIQITKVVLYARPQQKARTRGLVLTIINNNNTVIYTAKPITSKMGEDTYNQNSKDGYDYVTYNIPNPQWVGS